MLAEAAAAPAAAAAATAAVSPPKKFFPPPAGYVKSGVDDENDAVDFWGAAISVWMFLAMKSVVVGAFLHIDWRNSAHPEHFAISALSQTLLGAHGRRREDKTFSRSWSERKLCFFGRWLFEQKIDSLPLD